MSFTHQEIETLITEADQAFKRSNRSDLLHLIRQLGAALKEQHEFSVYTFGCFKTEEAVAQRLKEELQQCTEDHRP